jgi:hypothetical protein
MAFIRAHHPILYDLIHALDDMGVCMLTLLFCTHFTNVTILHALATQARLGLGTICTHCRYRRERARTHTGDTRVRAHERETLLGATP